MLLRRVVRSPKQLQYARRWQAARCLQLAVCTFWPALLLWVLVSGPGKASSGAARARIRSTLTETETVSASGGEPLSQALLEQKMAELHLTEWLTQPKQVGDVRLPLERAMAEVESGGSGADKGAKSKSAGEHITSSLKVNVAPDSKGLPTKYYYTFQNVRLTRDKLQFFTPPDFTYPATHWVDMVTCNATRPDPPTMLVIKGEAKGTKWYYLPVKYSPAASVPVQCKGWIDKPTFFLQVRYSHNIWHTWNEGLMSAFQTLREQGALPLVQIDSDGNMREVTEGMGKACPLVYDLATNSSRPDTGCLPKAGAVVDETCDPKNQRWCRPGIWSYYRDDGPLILPYTAKSVMNQWAQIYAALSEDVRDFSLVDGYCFRNLIIGRTSTLNYYQAINATASAATQDERVEAMGVFKAFVTTAQQEWVQQESAKKPWIARYKGYKDKKLERLRKGVGPEDISLVDSIMPTEVPGTVSEERDDLHKLWEKKKKAMDKEDKEVTTPEDAAGQVDDPTSLFTRGRTVKHAVSFPELRQQAPGLEQGGGGGTDGAWQHGSQAAVEATTQQGVVPAEGSSEEVVFVGDEEEPDEAELEARQVDRETALRAMPLLVPPEGLPLEMPRPVVTYMARLAFSRSVLNDHDILRYILSRYNVTVRVTTFEEPLLEVLELLQHTDVLIGMHGAGWTNGLFVKHGATAVQLFPYGWRLPSGEAIRGYNYQEIVLANKCNYLEWFNTHSQNAFFRREDWPRSKRSEYHLHPHPDEALPKDGWPGNRWVYQNTYVDMTTLGPVLDEAMQRAKIPAMEQQQQQQGVLQQQQPYRASWL